jgi:alanine-synthesizing transaminase
MFSARTPSLGALRAVNRLTRALAARDRSFIDLTVTNPTAAGLAVDDTNPLLALGDPRGLAYAPDPKGLRAARDAVAARYATAGAAADPDRIVLTASSSEAYGWLFKLTAEPGDAVLVPAPSYPLLDALADLEGVVLRRYPLAVEDGFWVHASAVEVEVDRLAAVGTRVAAVVLVNPNNPTGTSIERSQLLALFSLAKERGFAVISDEVFLDYRFAGRPADVAVAAAAEAEPEALVFSLGGLSKSAALPQVKLGWILANGPGPLLAEALLRLEWIADTFLSVSTPAQLALPKLLEWGDRAAAVLRARLLANHATLAAAFPPRGRATAQPLVGGWSGVVRVPAVLPEEELVLGLLEDHDVLVHPGYFFEYPFEAFVVVSLLPEPQVFSEGALRIARALERLS